MLIFELIPLGNVCIPLIPNSKLSNTFTVLLKGLLLYRHLQHHNDTIIKTQTQEDFFRKVYTSRFICKGSKGLCGFLLWEGAGDRTESAIFRPPHLWPSALCLSCSPDAQPVAHRPTLLGDGFLYCILSASSLDPNSSGPQWPLWPDVAFLTTSRPSPLQL